MPGISARPTQEELTNQQEINELLQELHTQLDDLAQSIVTGAGMIVDEQLSDIWCAAAIPAGSRTAEELRRQSQRAEELETLRMRVLETYLQYNTRRLEIDQIENQYRRSSVSSIPQHGGDRRASFGIAEDGIYPVVSGLSPNPSLRQVQIATTRRQTDNAMQQHTGLIGTLDADRATVTAENQARSGDLAQRMGDQGPGVPVPFNETSEYAEQNARRLAEERYSEEPRLQAMHGARLGDQGPGSPILPQGAGFVAVNHPTQVPALQFPESQNHRRDPAVGALPSRVRFFGDEIYQTSIGSLNEEVQVLAEAAQFLRCRMSSQRQTQQHPDPRLAAQLYAVESALQDAQNQLAMSRDDSVSWQPNTPINFNAHLQEAYWHTPRSALLDLDGMQVSRSPINIAGQSRERSFEESRNLYRDLRDILEGEEDDQDTENLNYASRWNEVD